MSGVTTLVKHSLRRRRTFLSIGVLFVAFFQIFMTFAAREIHRKVGFTQLSGVVPSFIEQWTNMVALSFKGMVLFGYSHPLVELFLIAVAVSVATEPVEEIESKFVDLLMARPIHRAAAVVRSIVVLLCMTAAAAASMSAGQYAGLRLLKPADAEAPDVRVSVSLLVNLAALVLAWGGIALAIASFARRRAAAAGICGFVVFAMFVLDYVGRFVESVASLSRISPFHYYGPFALIGGAPLPSTDLIVLAAIFVGGSATATIAYARRDL